MVQGAERARKLMKGAAPPGLKSSVVYPHRDQAAQVGSSSSVQMQMHRQMHAWCVQGRCMRQQGSKQGEHAGSEPAGRSISKHGCKQAETSSSKDSPLPAAGGRRCRRRGRRATGAGRDRRGR